jgi:hypothetical protein
MINYLNTSRGELKTMTIDFATKSIEKKFKKSLQHIKLHPIVKFLDETVPNYAIYPSFDDENRVVSVQYNVIEDKFRVDISVFNEAEVFEIVALLEEFKQRRSL